MPRHRIPTASQLIKTAEALKSSDPNGNLFSMLPLRLSNFFKKYPPSPFASYAEKPTITNAADANPFLPNKHPITNKWHKPKYSLRRQADLFKEAYRFGIEHLLPRLGNNKTLYEQRYETKSPVRGSVEFKLSKGERVREKRAAEVDEALAKADDVIAEASGAGARRRLERKRAQKPGFF